MARCGDGVLWQGIEGCDDGNRNTMDACTNACEQLVVVMACFGGTLRLMMWVTRGVTMATRMRPMPVPKIVDPLAVVTGSFGRALKPVMTATTGAVTAVRMSASSAFAATGNRAMVRTAMMAMKTIKTLRNACELARCGDGIVRLDAEAPEECDDGNADDGDDCLPNCMEARCGDGVLWIDEEDCDDGNATMRTVASQPVWWRNVAMVSSKPVSKIATMPTTTTRMAATRIVNCWQTTCLDSMTLPHAVLPAATVHS